VGLILKVMLHPAEPKHDRFNSTTSSWKSAGVGVCSGTVVVGATVDGTVVARFSIDTGDATVVGVVDFPAPAAAPMMIISAKRAPQPSRPYSSPLLPRFVGAGGGGVGYGGGGGGPEVGGGNGGVVMALHRRVRRQMKNRKAKCLAVRLAKCVGEYTSGMANTTFRTDGPSEAALAELTADGTDKSAVIREAIVQLARSRHQDALRVAAERLAADPTYQAEVAAVQDDFEDARAW
jgi:hypothetical protein